MADDNSDTEFPPTVLEVLRMILAAKSRGEKATLVLETRNGILITKFKCVETVSGAPTASTFPSRKRKVNPARARRSQLRLEQFMEKKNDENLRSQTTSKLQGQSVGKPAVLCSEKEKMTPASKEEDNSLESVGIVSPIPQLDGEVGDDGKVIFQFRF